MSVVDVAAWASTTGRKLEGARISNIYRDGDRFHIKLKQPGQPPILVYAEPGTRIHVTRVPRRPPKEFKNDSLQATLRKYLRNRVLGRVEQIGFDRIIQLKAGDHTLVVELLSRGVLALLDPEGRILVASKYVQMRDRSIKPKHPYTPPPSKTVHPQTLDTHTLLEHLEGKPDLVRGIVRGLGLPGDFAEEAVHRAGLSLEQPPTTLQRSDAENLLQTIRQLYQEALAGKGYLVYRDGDPYQATSFKPTYYVEKGYKCQAYQTLDEALDALFTPAPGQPRQSRLAKLIEEETARVRSSIARHHQTIREYEEKAEELREQANLIAQHYTQLSQTLECINTQRARKGWRAAASCPHVKALHPSLGKIEVALGDTRLTLDVRKTLDQHIRELYKKAGELEGKARRARRMVSELQAKLADAERKAKLRYARETLSRQPREWYERYHWTITPSGMLVIAGRNIDQNEAIVRKHMEEHDIFLHAVIHGAPATILKTGGEEPGQKDIREAAQIAASYSRAWNAGAGYVDVFWVNATQVSKTPPSGEYLAKGSFMVYGSKNYIRGVQLRLYLGIQPQDTHRLRIIVGTKENVTRKTAFYTALQPGSLKKEEAAQKIKERMKTRAAKDEAILIDAIPDEWIIERLPGRVQIVEWGKGETPIDTEEFFTH